MFQILAAQMHRDASLAAGLALSYLRRVKPQRFLMLMLALAMLAAPLAAGAQQVGHVPLIGVVTDPPHDPNLRLEAFRKALQELSHREGRSVRLEVRRWDGTSGQTPGIVSTLVRIPVDVLVVPTTGATVHAMRETKTIPIVSAAAGALVEVGAIASLARPGGNVTGLTSVQSDLSAKRLDLLKQSTPGLSHVAVFMSPYREVPAVGEHLLRDTEMAASMLGVRVEVIQVEQVRDLDRPFKIATRNRAEAGLILPNQFWAANAKRVGALSLSYRLPVMAQERGIVEAGGLVQYGVDIVDLWRRAAGYVDKILKGAKPGDLPVEEPTKFELVINLKTAKVLGLTIPPSLLLRADQVIQ